MKKLIALVAVGVGYVLGAKAGRERYEQIMRTKNKIKNDPRVQEKAHQAADLAREKAPVVKHKVGEAASSVTDKVKGGPDPAVGDQLNPDSTHFQEDPYPQGDLP